jgi:hypothetical protein
MILIYQKIIRDSKELLYVWILCIAITTLEVLKMRKFKEY